MPAESLFADKEWLISPEPFAISDRFADELDKLGYRLHLFVRAVNHLYQLSARGKQPRWIAEYFDRGKPRELIEFSRRTEFRDDIPRVIRPDLILTGDREDSFAISELDSVPGGIGLTAWLGQTYAQFGGDILGGAHGMLGGFRSIFPGGDILVSTEAATYKPEMEWLAAQLNHGVDLADHSLNSANRHLAKDSSDSKNSLPLYRVFDADNYDLRNSIANHEASQDQPSRAIYRFFELFDLPNIPTVPALLSAAANGQLRITPPIKPQLEEKMAFALFWLRPLREFWRRELGERHFIKLQRVIPYTWIVDPAPLPQHAVIPELGINDWRELGAFSQKQRELILKISGFSELGWGARSVSLGSDMPHGEWRAALENALTQFPQHPYILQRFHKGRLVEQPYIDPANGELRTMQGRVRLCPYYFIANGKANIGGALATICPADKKLLHGMKDAILTPTAVVAD